MGEIDVDPKYLLRLRELGVRPGAEFTVVNRAAFGGVVVNIAGTRVAVDAGSAKHIEVVPLDAGASAVSVPAPALAAA